MCGICGFVGPSDPDALVRMRDALTHRGPDEAGVFSDSEVSLGHRRLSIVDLTSGRQPIFSEDESIVLIANGEIYNHPELRPRLEAAGHRYGANSDCESIIHAYEEYGTDCPERLDGMFAFVLYDRRRRRLFGARDRMGKKPLYVTAQSFGAGERGVRFAFASEVKSLLRHPAIAHGASVSTSGIVSYLLNDYVLGTTSIYDGVHRLAPGHAFEFGLPDSPAPGYRDWRYWDIELPAGRRTLDSFRPSRSASKEEAGRTVLDLLGRAVERRLMADVPLGVFLSGGIDSTCIVALLTRILPAKEIRTFSIGFEEASFDESTHAERIARHYGTDHHVRRFTASECLDRLPAVVGMLDEPFADPSILPTSMLCGFARERVTVALGGDGGDELLAGYDPFRALAAGRAYDWLVPKLVHERLVDPLLRRLPVSDRNMSLPFKAVRFLRGVGVERERRMSTWMGAFSLAQLRRLTPDLGELLDPEVAYRPVLESYRRLQRTGADDVTLALDFFQRFYLVDDILVKADRASMMHSLEVRSPFLDTELVRYVNALPARLKYRRGVTKYLLKRALETQRRSLGMFPLEPIRRAKKGFGVPVARWIRHELRDRVRETLLDDWPAALDMFDRSEIARLHHEHLHRRANHYKELWALFMLALWHREHRRGS